jgi:hypothetical protein
MPVVSPPQAIHPAVLADPARRWRKMLRIDSPGGDLADAVRETNAMLPERLVYAEGDSWFGKFTALRHEGTNLLDAIRLPFLAAVVDVSQTGGEVRDMVRGHQARQTRAMFKLFGFHAILLSAGGNDLKNAFADLFAARALRAEGLRSRFQPGEAQLALLDHPARLGALFDDVARDLGRFVDLRDAAGNATTAAAPIFVHGYDYLQPRPAKACVFGGDRLGPGPWLHPVLRDAGLDEVQMQAAVREVIDTLNERLHAVVAPLHNVHVIDQRGVLAPASAGSTGPEGDWADEIHPSKQGFDKLARSRWDVPLARALGWQPGAQDLQEAR